MLRSAQQRCARHHSRLYSSIMRSIDNQSRIDPRRRDTCSRLRNKLFRHQMTRRAGMFEIAVAAFRSENSSRNSIKLSLQRLLDLILTTDSAKNNSREFCLFLSSVRTKRQISFSHGEKLMFSTTNTCYVTSRSTDIRLVSMRNYSRGSVDHQ